MSGLADRPVERVAKVDDPVIFTGKERPRVAKQPRSIAGRVVAITGAARGIGRATAEALVREGATVAIGDIDLALAERTAKHLGPRATAFALDVTDRASFEQFFEAVERFGSVDALINNAGIMPLGRFADEDDATARRLVDINVHGVMLGMKVALPRFAARREGHLINIASAAGKGPYPGGATYCGTKHFVVGVSETVRGELRGTGVDLSVVMPVVVDTELAAGVGTPRGIPRIQPEDVAAAIVETLRRPRFDVYVPRSIGPLIALGGLMPRRVHEALMRAIAADRVLQVDGAARREYELRATGSQPAVPPDVRAWRLTEAGD
jgi:NADP-dependent 3-hydroxy acid dehydrogenase YdfG